MRIVQGSVENGFVMVPCNLFRSCLDTSEQLTWIGLQSLCYGNEHSESYRSWNDIAKALGKGSRGFYKTINKLKAAGALIEKNGDWALIVPVGPRPVEADEEDESDTMIADEMATQEKRKRVLTKQERKVMIRDAWNKYRPQDNEAMWPKLDGSVPQPALDAIDAQTKFLGHDAEDYDGLIRQVIRGALTMDYWTKKRTAPIKIWTLLGWLEYYKGEKGLNDADHRRAKELYIAGESKKAVSAAFDSSDEAFLEWFHREGETKYTKVERITVEDRFEGSAKERKCLDDGTIRLYIEEDTGKVVFWTLRDNFRFRYLP